MFKSNKAPALAPSTDYTGTLRETSFYKYGHLRTLGLTGEITALAVDPILSLLAIGTSAGLVHVYGSPAFQFTLPVSTSGAGGASGGALAIKFIVFHPGHSRIVVIDNDNTIHSFALNNISDSANPNAQPPLPVREATYSLFGHVTAVEQPLPSYTHMFITMKDGLTLTWDLRQRVISTYKIQNLWALHEERLVRSGVPGKVKTLGGPMATCSAINPRDLNILLVGYEGGVVAWDFQQGIAVKMFEMTLPPGAPGGGSYLDHTLWTERIPSVSCIVWRPDGLVFAVGHADGCISFWAYADSDKPLMVRTLTHEDVNVTDAETLLSAGALDNQVRSTKEFEGMPVLPAAYANREPIFKLSWAGFPDQASLKTLIAAQTTDPTGELTLSAATIDYAERGETLLLVLGGQSPGEKPGINILQFPSYHPPQIARRGNASSISEGMPLPERYAFRDSLTPTGTSNYPTPTVPEDFILLPRSSPYFAQCYDPISILITLTPDSTLPRASTPAAERHLEAYVFPPPRSSVAPPSLGRKNFLTPGEGEKIVAMTPAPLRASAPLSPSGRRPSSPGWRFPWSASSSTSDLTIPSPSSNSKSQGQRAKLRRRLRGPSQIWTGGLSVLGCRLMSLPTSTFKRLISYSIETAGLEKEPRLPLRGGMAVPDLQSHGAPDVKVVKMENYRVLSTWHADGTVRFWDVSPHILLLPTPLRFEYPSPLPHLTISIGDYLWHPSIAHLPLAKLWMSNKAKVQITGVHLARESLECVITFATGEVLVTKFGEGKAGQNGGEEIIDEDSGKTSDSGEYFPNTAPNTSSQEWIEEMTEIDHLANWSDDGFKPVVIFTVKRGEAVACAVSDIGFIAVAFATKSLAIIDMRGPDVILREGFNEDGATMKKRKKKGSVQNVGSENSLIESMKWVISGLGADSTPRPRLIVSYAKGLTKIYCLVNVLGEWMVDPKPPVFTNESLVNPIATFVLDPVSGNELFPSAQALAEALQHKPTGDPKAKDAPPHCLWIAASKHTIRIAVNFSGERVAKVELEQEELSDVHYITRHGHRVLVALTTKGSALFYSMPFLEYITRVDLYFGGLPRPLGKLSFDDRSGDFVEYSGPLDIALRTVFHFRKPFPPRIDPCAIKYAIPPQPAPVNASAFGWMWGGAPLTGAGLDSLVAGPSRPQAPKPPPAPKKPLITWGNPPEEPVVKATPSSTTTVPKRTAVTKQRAPTRDERERTDAYSDMQNAASQRGDVLDMLGEQLNSATVSASNYLQSARNTALKEAAKGTVTGAFGKFF